MRIDNNKVAIVGCGNIGMTAAYSLLHTGVVNELVLVGRSKQNLIGEQLDLEHGMSFLPHCRVSITDSYADLVDTDIVIYTAGVPQKPGDTRLDLCAKNTEILEEIFPQITQNAPNAIILMVANPVDILTYKAYKMARIPKGRIFGTGTTLDTARFRFHLSEFLKLSPQSIHAYVLGEHGDSSFPAFSSATVGGQSLESLERYTDQKGKSAFELARTAAAKIIATKGATSYGIGIVIATIVTKILRDARSILPVSIPLHGNYDLSGVALSVPCVIGRNGVEDILEIRLNWEEKQKLARSANVLKAYL